MDLNKISGNSAYSFMQKFGYIREAGTQGEKRASDGIAESLRALGLEPEIEEFDILRSVVHGASFKVTSPFEKEIPVVGTRGTCSTAPDGVKAEFLFVGEGDEISLSQAKSKIILISHRPTADEYHTLMQTGAVGLVYVCGCPTDKGEDRLPEGNKIYYKGEPTLPTVSMHYLDARELVESGADEVCLTASVSREASRSRNVFVTIPGTVYPNKTIILSAHYDSVPDGVGAYDNLAGSAIIYEVCRYFAANPPKHTLKFVFTGAEEIGTCGSIDFLKRREAEWKDCILDINVDLAGQTIGGTVIGVTGDKSIMAELKAAMTECRIGAGMRQDVWSGDANAFARCGIPAITLDRDGFGMHTRYDTLDLISPWALERDAKLCAYIADRFDNEEAPSFNREIPEFIMVELKERYRGIF